MTLEWHGTVNKIYLLEEQVLVKRAKLITMKRWLHDSFPLMPIPRVANLLHILKSTSLQIAEANAINPNHSYSNSYSSGKKVKAPVNQAHSRNSRANKSLYLSAWHTSRSVAMAVLCKLSKKRERESIFDNICLQMFRTLGIWIHVVKYKC